MIKQYRKVVNQVILEFPAGKADQDENLLEAAKRELQEETGYTAENWIHIAEVFASPGYTTEIFSMWLARDLKKGEQNLDEGENLDVVEYSPLELWHGYNKNPKEYNLDCKSYALLMRYLIQYYSLEEIK